MNTCKTQRCLLVYSHLHYFLLSVQGCGVGGGKKGQKCSRHNFYPVYDLLKVQYFSAWAVLSVHTVCDKTVSFKKAIYGTSILEICRGHTPPLPREWAGHCFRSMICHLDSAQSFEPSKDNGMIHWQWQWGSTVSHLAEKWLCTMTFLQNIPCTTKNLESRDHLSQRWVSVK